MGRERTLTPPCLSPAKLFALRLNEKKRERKQLKKTLFSALSSSFFFFLFHLTHPNNLYRESVESRVERRESSLPHTPCKSASSSDESKEKENNEGFQTDACWPCFVFPSLFLRSLSSFVCCLSFSFLMSTIVVGCLSLLLVPLVSLPFSK